MSIVANGQGGGPNCGGGQPVTDAGYNIDTGSSCGFSTANHSLSNTSPQLGPLATNGGPTQTMALPAGSPAVDAIPASTVGLHWHHRPARHHQAAGHRLRHRRLRTGAERLGHAVGADGPDRSPAPRPARCRCRGTRPPAAPPATPCTATARPSAPPAAPTPPRSRTLRCPRQRRTPTRSTPSAAATIRRSPRRCRRPRLRPAAPAAVQSGAVSTASQVTSTTITLSAPVHAGDLLVGWFGAVQLVRAGEGLRQRQRRLDPQPAPRPRSAAAAVTSRCTTCRTPPRAPNGLTITISASNATYLEGAVGDYSGVATTGAIDQLAVAKGNSTTVDSGPPDRSARANWSSAASSPAARRAR